jgi:hypothetical protein
MSTKMHRSAQNVPNIAGQVIRSAMWRDAITAFAGKAAKRSAPTDKAYARAMGVSQPTANRRRNGDPYSPEAFVLSTFDKLSGGDRTTAYPLLIQAWSVVNQREIKDAPSHRLALRRDVLELEQHDHIRDIAAAKQTGDEDALCDAHAAAAECHAELMAIVREQAERKRRRA